MRLVVRDSFFRSFGRLLGVAALFIALAAPHAAAQIDGLVSTVRKGPAPKETPRLPGARVSDNPYQTPSLEETTIEGLPEKHVPLYRKYPADLVVVAEVGDTVLTRAQLNRMAASKALMVKSELWMASGDEETNRRERENRLLEAEEEVLYEWAGLKCLKILAERQGLRVSDEEVSKSLARAETDAGTGPDGESVLAQAHEALGIGSAELRREMREALLVDKYILWDIEHTFKEDDLRQIYTATPGRYATPRLYHTWQILKRIRPDMLDKEKRDVRKSLDKLRKNLAKAGLSEFQAAARAESQDERTRATGGDLGWLDAAAAANPQMTKTLMSLPVGQASDIVETRAGLHLLMITEIREAAGQTFDPVARQRVTDELVCIFKRNIGPEIIRDPSLNVKVRLNSSGLWLLGRPASETTASKPSGPERENLLVVPAP